MFNDGKLYLIGEIGLNHNSDYNIIIKLIDAINCCGWNCAKFQKRDPNLIPESMKSVIRDTPWGKITYLEYKRKIELDLNTYFKIDSYIDSKSIDWTTSVWDIPSINFMKGFESVIPFIKIPSALNTNVEFLREISNVFINKYIILSTGMCTFEELDVSVNEILKKTDKLILMHTNSTYPSPYNQLNLSLIPILKERYKLEVGYSGHEEDLTPTIIAYMMGARIIERHITLDHSMWGTDQKSSLEINGMVTLKKRLEDIDIMIGNGKKIITDDEWKKRLQLAGK